MKAGTVKQCRILFVADNTSYHFVIAIVSIMQCRDRVDTLVIRHIIIHLKVLNQSFSSKAVT